jgi:hypothetical protein
MKYDLARHAANVYSQNGEDGILAEVFRRIGTTNRWCFEVGAADGLLFSNVRRLIEQGWGATLIEADQQQYRKLQALYCDGPANVVTACRLVSAERPDRLDDLVGERRPDLGVIDVDGQDYYLWLSMVRVRPRVMVVEFDHNAKDEMFVPRRGGPGQAAYTPTMMVGLAKNYLPVARTLCNAVFVERESLGLLGD